MFRVPESLAINAGGSHEGRDWLEALPRVVEDLQRRWSLKLGAPFEGQGSASWTAPVLAHREAAVLKVGMPHMEAEHEIPGLRFWDGEPTVRLFEADESVHAMLIERCRPGTSLRTESEPAQDRVIARLLRRLWRSTGEDTPFRPLAAMLSHWIRETLEARLHWLDAGLVEEGLTLFEELPRSAPESVLLATDLHAGNVLHAERERWLVIDPKPFVGDPAYDATQHLLNCRGRLRDAPYETVDRFSDLLEVSAERVRLWTFARLATEVDGPAGKDAPILARLLAP